MNNFFSFIDQIAEHFSNILGYTLQFFGLVRRSSSYLFEVLLLLPPYFYIGIAPFFALFIVLLILDRG